MRWAFQNAGPGVLRHKSSSNVVILGEGDIQDVVTGPDRLLTATRHRSRRKFRASNVKISIPKSPRPSFIQRAKGDLVTA